MDGPSCSKVIAGLQVKLSKIAEKYSSSFRTTVILCSTVLFFVYFAYSMTVEFGDEGSLRLLGMTILVALAVALKISQRLKKKGMDLQSNAENNKPLKMKQCFHIRRFLRTIRFSILFPSMLLLGFCAFVIFEVGRKRPRNMMSFAGIAFFLISGYLFSHNPSKVFM